MTVDEIIENDLVGEIRFFSEVDNHDFDANFIDEKYRNFLSINKEFSNCNNLYLTSYFNSMKDNCKAILEIGICRNQDESSTYCFLNNKNSDTYYFGIDLDDKSFLDNESENVFTMRENSSNIEKIMRFVNSKGVEKFDFIFIDGWHSINQVLNDWKFTEFLDEGGIVGFHDTNHHPGPKTFVNALDPNKFTINKHCSFPLIDWGIAFVKRK
jgi:hypothetical protein